MKYFIVFVCSFAAVNGASIPERIVGGINTDISKFPSTVQIDFLWSGSWLQACAGTVLTSRLILSAAHCFAASEFTGSNRRVRAGATTRNSGGILVYVSRRINHPNYNMFFDCDISLVYLDSTLIMSSVIQQGTIPAHNSIIPDNASVVYVGWGSLWNLGPPATQLQEVTVNHINRNVCAQRYAATNAVVTSNMICAGVLDIGGKDACQGDGGGPLIYNNVVVGIISWGMSCGFAFYPGVNTDVSRFTNWIVANAV